LDDGAAGRVAGVCAVMARPQAKTIAPATVNFNLFMLFLTCAKTRIPSRSIGRNQEILVSDCIELTLVRTRG
jgi:hypothetical protein